jgi:hypothetical protein
MEEAKTFPFPKSYIRLLDKKLRETVPVLYNVDDSNLYRVELGLSEPEKHEAAVIFNNAFLCPKQDNNMTELPKNKEAMKRQTGATKRQTVGDVIGFSWIDDTRNFKTCGWHRLSALRKTSDYLCLRNSAPILNTLVQNLWRDKPDEKWINEFTAALQKFFYSAEGLDMYRVFTYQHVGNSKDILVYPVYISSVKEYISLYTNKLTENISQERKLNYTCIWCYPSYLALAAHGSSKGYMYDNPQCIPHAMKSLIPLEHIESVEEPSTFTKDPSRNEIIYSPVKETTFPNIMAAMAVAFEDCSKKGNMNHYNYTNSDEYMIRYNQIIHTLWENIPKDCPNKESKLEELISKYQTALFVEYKKNIEPDESLQEILNLVNLSLRDSFRYETNQSESELVIRYGNQGRVIKEVKKDTGDPLVTLGDFIKFNTKTKQNRKGRK